MTHEQKIDIRQAILALYPEKSIFDYRVYIQAERDGLITPDEYRELTR